MQATNPGLLNVLMGLGTFFKLVRNPADLDKVFAISRKLGKPEILAPVADAIAARASHSREALEQRPRLNLAALTQRALPPGSLGQSYLAFMQARGLDPANIPTLPGKTREEYVLAHLYETHDLWHVLCGFDTDVAGELGLQAFYSAQIPTPLSLVLLSSGFLNTALFAMSDRAGRMAEIIRGWQMGTQAKSLFGVDWSTHWDLPLAEVRSQFGLAS